MTKSLLFLDMDGVLVDFDKGLKAKFLCTYNQTNHPIEELSPELREVKNNLWDWVSKNPDFWTDLSPMPDAQHLWQQTEGAGYAPFILTAAPSRFIEGDKDFKEVAHRKWRWVQENLGFNDASRFICTTSKKKPLFMNSMLRHRNILVDDRSENIRDWNANGGTGILHINAVSSLHEMHHHHKNWVSGLSIKP